MCEKIFLQRVFTVHLLLSISFPLAVTTTSLLMNDSHLEISLNASHWSFGQSGSLWFRTRETDGLLMYTGRKPGKGNVEFLLLDITSGKARFTADLGSGIVSSIVVKHYFTGRATTIDFAVN